MTGKAAKTNFGQSIQKNDFEISSGVPGNHQYRMATGSVVDIRFPGEVRPKEGFGIMVKIKFDNSEYTFDGWVPLKDSYQTVIGTVGTKEAFMKNGARVNYHFNTARLREGYAELICDNKEEGRFNSYTRNASANYIGALFGMKFSNRSKI